MSPGSQTNLPHRSMRAELPSTMFSMARLRERSYYRKIREERRRETGALRFLALFAVIAVCLMTRRGEG